MTFSCHCCGTGFEGDTQDPARDTGYGTCPSCEDWIAERDEQEWQKLIGKVRGALNKKNRAKFDSFDKDMRRAVVGMLIDDGLLTWEIRRTA
jgi:hypothetical protein